MQNELDLPRSCAYTSPTALIQLNFISGFHRQKQIQI